MQDEKVTTLKIAATYIGTVIGAGFASGQELLQFFVVFGAKGILGLIVVTILFIYFGYVLMTFGKKLNSTSHEAIVHYACGKFIGTFLDYGITFFLFGGLTAMIAGSGALIHQLFHISGLWGNLLMTILTMLTVLTGIKGVINAISFVVPFLLISTIGISIASYFLLPPQLETFANSAAQAGPLMQNWWWAAILYTSYNIILSIAILAPLGAKAKNQKSIRNGALLGGLGLGIGALAIFLTISRSLSSVIHIEIPMIYMAHQLSNTVQFIYSFVLIAEIYTTAVGSLYGFAARLTNNNATNTKSIIVIMALLGLLASQLGFTTLVKYYYPLIGYCGIILLFFLLFVKFKGSHLSKG